MDLALQRPVDLTVEWERVQRGALQAGQIPHSPALLEDLRKHDNNLSGDVVIEHENELNGGVVIV